MRTHIRFNALAQHTSAFCRSRHPKDAPESLASRRGDYIPPSITPLSSDITPLQGSKHKASWMLERFFTEPRGHGLREVFRSPVRAPRWTLNKKSHGFCLSSTTMMTLGPPTGFSIRTRIQAGGVNSHTPASAILCAP